MMQNRTRGFDKRSAILYPLWIHSEYKGRARALMSEQAPLSKGAATVYEQLRHQILHGEMGPGTVLQQVELAQRLGVSRTPVRHALQQLTYDGLVEILPGQTARVITTGVQDMFEMRQIRMWLEVPAILMALRRNPRPTPLIEILDQVEALGNEATPDSSGQLVRLDEKFHRWLVHECGNVNLERIVGRFLDRLYAGTAFNAIQDYATVRANLLSLRTAVIEGNMSRVRQLMIEHMTDTGTLAIEPLGFEDTRPNS